MENVALKKRFDHFYANLWFGEKGGGGGVETHEGRKTRFTGLSCHACLSELNFSVGGWVSHV